MNVSHSVYLGTPIASIRLTIVIGFQLGQAVLFTLKENKAQRDFKSSKFKTQTSDNAIESKNSTLYKYVYTISKQPVSFS